MMKLKKLMIYILRLFTESLVDIILQKCYNQSNFEEMKKDLPNTEEEEIKLGNAENPIRNEYVHETDNNHHNFKETRKDLPGFIMKLFKGNIADQLDSFIYVAKTGRVPGLSFKGTHWKRLSNLTESKLKYRKGKVVSFAKDHKISVESVISEWLKLLLNNNIAKEALMKVEELKISLDIFDRKSFFENVHQEILQRQKQEDGRKN